MRIKNFLFGLALALSSGYCVPPPAPATVSNTTTQTTTGYGDGSTVIFNITFDFRANSWITVTEYDTSVTPTLITYIPQGSGAGKFTVSGTTVVMGTAPTSTQYLVIGRNIPIVQPVVFNPASIFPYQGLSSEVDQLTLAIQNTNAGLLVMTPLGCPASQWVSGVLSNGQLVCSQPGFTDIAGTLGVAAGGTGLTSSSTHGVLLGEGTSAFGNTGTATSGLPLLSTGLTSDPSYGPVVLTTAVTGVLPVANGGTGNTSGAATTNANLTGPITSVGNATSVAAQTGTGSTFVMASSPTLVTPNLGTPSALVGTNITGTASGLTAGTVTTNANLTGGVTSVGNAATVVTNANLTGDVTSVGNATTLATVNSNTGSFGSSTSIPNFTVNGKGLITAAGGNAVIAPAGTLSGATLASGVTASSLTSFGSSIALGTPASGVATNLTGLPLTTGVTGILPIANGGTNASTAAAGFGNLSPLTTKGDLLGYDTANGRFPIGSDGEVLSADSTQTKGLKWIAAGGTVTAVSIASSNGFTGSSSGGATPALTIATSITGVVKGNGTAISAATSGTDYSAGTSALATGILKSTTSTGALTIAASGDFPTLNQSTSGNAANITGNLVFSQMTARDGTFANSTATSSLASTFTTVPIGTVVKDTNSNFASNTFTAKTAGWHTISGAIETASTAYLSGDFLELEALINSTSFILASLTVETGFTNSINLTGSLHYYLSVNDTVVLKARKITTSAAPTYSGNANSNYFSVVYIGP